MVNISDFGKGKENRNFSSVDIFTTAVFWGVKIPLDKEVCLGTGDFPLEEHLYMVDGGKANHNVCKFLKNKENNRKFLQKGIDFMGKLRYNWTVRKQIRNRRCNNAQH